MRNFVSSLVIVFCLDLSVGHTSKDLDDSILYQIDFEYPNFNENPELKGPFPKFYTHDKEVYECVLPVYQERKEKENPSQHSLSPYDILQAIFKSPSCSYRIEAYWSYEICHGRHVRQYHEEREGKNVKFQEYYLGTWQPEKVPELVKTWMKNQKAGVKYKTKIDNTNYPYFEVEMTDGELCEIINAPRTTSVRYVCDPNGQNEIYSFKETSSCHYEAIILNSVLCNLGAFHPEETKELSIKCFTNPTETIRPLSMLKQEYEDMPKIEDDLATSENLKNVLLALNTPIVTTAGIPIEPVKESPDEIATTTKEPIVDLTPIKEFISGKNCLTGGTGWWKYEFCYGRHVRQFHRDKQSETQLYLGYFSETSHRQWVKANPEKGSKRSGSPDSIWHHYDKGTYCDRSGLKREVDVKLTCTPAASSLTTVSMYLLEPNTCQYTLVVESPVICDLIQFTDEYGLVQEDKLQEYFKSKSQSMTNENTNMKAADKDKMPHYDGSEPIIHAQAADHERLADENA